MKPKHTMACADPEGGGGRGSDPPPPPRENHKDIEFLINTGLDPMENHKGTETTFNIGPPSARQRNAIKMAFRWWADDGPLLVVFGSTLPASTKKSFRVYPPLAKLFWIGLLSVYI